jgi:hypothetical protein
MTDERDEMRLENDEEQDVEGHSHLKGSHLKGSHLKGRALKGETDEGADDEVDGHMGLKGRALKGEPGLGG